MQIAYAPGDGIGKEIMNAVLKIFKTLDIPIEFIPVEMGRDVYLNGNSSGMTEEAKKVIEHCGLLFKGPMETPKGNGNKSINVTCRKMWNAFANHRVFKTYSGIETVFTKANIDINITIIRENIEDTYGAIEHMQTSDVAQCRRLVTRPGCLQVHRYAFELARKSGIRKITCGHKANIMKLTDGLFLESFYTVAKDYPEINVEDLIIDNLCMKLVTKPNEFEMIVLPNLQGDIVSDLCAGLVGGLGISPSANIGDNICVFEAVHGTAPDIVGKNIANPSALLLSGCMMLRHIGLDNYADHIENGMKRLFNQGIKTKDLCDNNEHYVLTNEFTEQLCLYLQTQEELLQPCVPNFQRPNKPKQFKLQVTNGYSYKETIGMDIFIDSGVQPYHIAETLNNNLPKNYTLQMISNRGTQVWPTGSLFTECVNHHRCRILCDQQTTDDQLYKVLTNLSKLFRICSVEMLINLDKQPGYSLAQGQ